MKITLQKTDGGEDEVTIRYREMTPEVEEVIRAAGGSDEKIPCWGGDEKRMLPVRTILYAESVDRLTFLYTADGVYQTSCSLQALERMYAGRGFFRCAKSMVLNIYRIAALRSEPGGRINAAMENGEHVIISRSYAKAFRRVLKGEDGSDER